ncbi:hypothetical protein BCR41DRAFT_16151 [Lobosporangium transversale]|uniref:Uncharacterized protein n=1 Tax=Lobosporangium transversale TaxID=64571 RepID=A0A1Y2GTJ0_9FUNG|nr:hypothetical protein BCR41DRAFT_16151 [Lobosporangium transversale]ORZ22837.1 hypothetical protein BCR41DRAFT_16151 [Lobosporangium transversale]|eukprot:XP_021883391.1 hypothetical protein BCR41DRAFT_16151 [Lobosporangium transversale]
MVRKMKKILRMCLLFTSTPLLFFSVLHFFFFSFLSSSLSPLLPTKAILAIKKNNFNLIIIIFFFFPHLPTPSFTSSLNDSFFLSLHVSITATCYTSNC